MYVDRSKQEVNLLNDYIANIAVNRPEVYAKERPQMIRLKLKCF